jgi:Uma2 family endonuclease
MISTLKAFEQVCAQHPDQMFEQTVQGEIIKVAPVGGIGGSGEAELIIELGIWNRQTKLGKVFSSQTVFQLPIGSKRAPDASWVKMDRWNTLSPEQQAGFPPLCPDFVIELFSPSGLLKDEQAKMLEYLASGCRLGWLINNRDRQVEIYRIGQAVEVVAMPVVLSGEDVLPGFELNV